MLVCTARQLLKPIGHLSHSDHFGSRIGTGGRQTGSRRIKSVLALYKPHLSYPNSMPAQQGESLRASYTTLLHFCIALVTLTIILYFCVGYYSL